MTGFAKGDVVTTVQIEPTVWRVDADLEQHFEESEWCHLFWPTSYGVAICGAHERTHDAATWDPKINVCPKCGRPTCVDCLHAFAAHEEGQ